MATITRAAGALPTSGGTISAAPLTDSLNNIMNFIEGSNVDENNVNLTATNGITGKSTTQTITGLKTFANTSAAAGGIRNAIAIAHQPGSGTAAANDGVSITLLGYNGSGNSKTFGEVDTVFTTVTAGAEVGRLDLKLMDAGTLRVASTLTAKGALTVGLVGTNTGKFIISGATSGLVTITSAAVAGTWTFQLPASGGTPNYALTTDGTGVGSWAQLSLTAGVTGVLPVANGGTNASTASITAFNNITGFTAAGTTGNTSTNLVFSTSPVLTTPALGTPSAGVLTSCTGLPLTTGVTGILPTANGGTGIAYFTAAGPSVARVYTFPDAATTVLTTNAAVTVAQGGTGVATLAANGVLYGNTTGVVLVTAQGAANSILTANAGAPVFSATPTIGTNVTVPIIIGGTNVGSTLTLQSTSATATTAAILFAGGTNGGTALGRITNAGMWLIGATTTNANMTAGLTIDQGGASDDIFALKSTSVTHGMTGLKETSTWFSGKKYSSTLGGANFSAYGTTAGTGFYLLEVHGTDNTTQSTFGIGGITLVSSKKSGTSNAAIATNANVFVVQNNGEAEFIVDGAGNLYANGGTLSTTMVTLYDEYDDVALLSAFDKMQSLEGHRGLIESEFEDFMSYNEQTLIDLNILGGPRVGIDPSQRGLINFTGLAKLHNGAIRQLGRTINQQQARISELESKLMLLAERN